MYVTVCVGLIDGEGVRVRVTDGGVGVWEVAVAVRV